jgi:exodeoxyribonuclease V
MRLQKWQKSNNMMTLQPPVSLTEEQLAAADYLLRADEQVSTLGGFAGTGKTTLIRHFISRLPDWAVCAYTGKAAQVLRKKGVTASTIHSLIYHVIKDEDGYPIEPVEFELAQSIPYRGIIVDEASMVSSVLYNDLLSFDLPIIFVGDHGQLPPVTKSKEVFNLMESPDVVLETIHRNAGEIAHFAHWLREGGDAAEWIADPAIKRQVKVYSAAQMDRIKVFAYDQVICAFNATRVHINKSVRESLGRTGNWPMPEDRVMCLQNSRTKAIFNGMQGVVGQVYGAEFEFNTDGRSVRVRYTPEAFNAASKPEYDRYSIPFDFCWAATCHKCQGDEFDKVLVIEQPCGAWDMCRWNYTAASRAKQTLHWVLPE